jgi:hypothetical protein
MYTRGSSASGFCAEAAITDRSTEGSSSVTRRLIFLKRCTSPPHFIMTDNLPVLRNMYFEERNM